MCLVPINTPAEIRMSAQTAREGVAAEKQKTKKKTKTKTTFRAPTGKIRGDEGNTTQLNLYMTT